MVSQTNEQALEASIERALTGISREELQEQAGAGDLVALKASVQYLSDTGHGYQTGWSSDFDRDLAVDRAKFWSFLEATQVDQLTKLKGRPNWQQLILEMLNKRIKKHGALKALVAFSGKKTVDGIEYTEERLNGFACKDIEKQFDTDEYRLLVVANKYLTGFDQPKLSTMYVDKKLHWLLKFLIPKLTIKDQDKEALDDLLESIDLSTYSLARTQLKAAIGLDSSDSELDPQNANPRGIHGEDEPRDPLDEIVRAFNERWFQGWAATPEEQRVKFINIAQHVMDNASYKSQVVDNPDQQNSDLALEKLIQEAISSERRRELDLYRNYAQDPDFRRAFDASIKRILSSRDGAPLTP